MSLHGLRRKAERHGPAGVFLLFDQLWGNPPASSGIAAKLFVPVWLALSIANPWIGVSRVGYTVAEEIPILLIVFAVPAALATVAVCQSAWTR